MQFVSEQATQTDVPAYLPKAISWFFEAFVQASRSQQVNLEVQNDDHGLW